MSQSKHPFLDDPEAQQDLEIAVISDDPEGTTGIYPDQPSFLPDGRYVYHQSNRGCLAVDLETGEREVLLPPIPREGLRISPGGKFILWRESSDDSDRLIIRRREVKTGHDEVVYEADGLLPGSKVPMSQFKIEAVSADGERIASHVWCGNGGGRHEFVLYCLDLSSQEIREIYASEDIPSAHLQYRPTTDPVEGHDLMIQQNHGAVVRKDGTLERGVGPPEMLGVDLHVLRDDGTHWRDFPFGRDGHESCIGHQLWRGNTGEALTVTLQNNDTSYGWADGTRQEILSGKIVPTSENEDIHQGANGRDAYRIPLSSDHPNARFCHLTCDGEGLQIIADTFPIYNGHRAGMALFLGRAPNLSSPARFQYLLNTGIQFINNTKYHAHPVLSPNGRHILFNATVNGSRQIWHIQGF